MAKTPAIERLIPKCNVTPPPVGSQLSTPCLSFMGAKRPHSGHGHIREDGKMSAAHRVAYEAKHGPIPQGMVVIHLCDNPTCCNTDHLALGSQRENIHDSVLKGRTKGKRKNVLPNLIKRICLLKKYDKTPEEIAHETGYSLTAILSLLDFLADDEHAYEWALERYGEELADHQRLTRLVYDQQSLTAIVAMLNTNTTN